METILTVPSWAPNVCYVYLAAAAIVVLNGIWALFQVFTTPSVVRKFIPMITLSIYVIISSIVVTVMTMMQFWICRSALKQTGAKEKFAVKCESETDCTAVTGTPQRDTCSCGGRGFCGGCQMQNNMEPSMLPEFGGQFSDISESFRGRR
jgi:hypothetical protein